MRAPQLIEFPRLGSPDIGYISVAEEGHVLPFVPRRVFWTYHTPEEIVRGRHAHYKSEHVLVAVAGRIVVVTEQANGQLQSFRLDSPHLGLYIPPSSWHSMHYAEEAIQLTFASELYQEEDYIRDYATFREVWLPGQP
ncbi:sugar 3,4-ketoisomerase [Hymenobacter guriensis]|uniref:FdtA/QdtA family cupin domain-containing protein n=1 Tax=Hymenobacter guriensis TaxID=2793065 RepID=A0ABS0KX05_9BACT|nr:FdtA/QdtA family cupin domain-containing protein [Hymenobacter guriensis]MBG8552300.1 FdtA/QdtA family cupin domain-containing protein [Hymenobacter guriensis]